MSYVEIQIHTYRVDLSSRARRFHDPDKPPDWVPGIINHSFLLTCRGRIVGVGMQFASVSVLYRTVSEKRELRCTISKNIFG